MDALVRLCDRRDTIGGFFKMRRHRRIVYFAGLKLEHARNDGETVLDPMRDLLQQHLVARKRCLVRLRS